MNSAEALLPRPQATLLEPRLRAISLGMLALITILAFEQLAVATVMPAVAQALGGMPLYAAAFGSTMASSILGMVLGGRWSDRTGPAPALWAGVAAFVLGVLAAGLAPDMMQLVLGRALQGLGGGLASVALYVVVGQVYPRELHPRVFSAFAAAWVVPAIAGPALAGFVAEQFGWRWVFLAAAVLAIPAGWQLHQGLARLPRRQARAQRPRDGAAPRATPWLAAATAVCAGLLYAGAGSPGPGMPLMACALLGVGILAPRLLPPGTLSGRPGLPAVVALRGLAAATFFSGEVLIPLLLVSERGLSPLQAGLVLTAGALGWSAGSWFQGRSAQRHRGAARARVLQTGMALISAGMLALPAVLLPGVPVAAAGLAWTVAGVGIGLVFPTLSVLTLECAPAAEHGAASSALQLSDALFSAVGLALASALLSALQPWSSTGAYVAGFGIAAAMSLAGLVLAPRARPQAR